MPDSDHTVWRLISTTLVMLTLPGVALFYGGMVRKKNVLNTMGLPSIYRTDEVSGCLLCAHYQAGETSQPFNPHVSLRCSGSCED